MKKWIVVPGTIAVIGCISFFIFTPLALSSTIAGNCSFPAADRCFEDTSGWSRWWPVNSGCTYRLMGVFYSHVRFSLDGHGYGPLICDIRLAPLHFDSSLINWEIHLPAGGNLVKKAMIYRHRSEIRRNMDAVIASFKAFIGDNRNIYGGVNFHRARSHDSALVTISGTSRVYPGVTEVYKRIDTLREYIRSRGAAAISPPWLNVTRVSDTVYKFMVAISVNKPLAQNGRIVPKRFVPWRNIEGEVHGGVNTVERAFGEMMKYKLDNGMTIVAMPYQALITDRRQEPDTSRWVTMVCAPIT